MRRQIAAAAVATLGASFGADSDLAAESLTRVGSQLQVNTYTMYQQRGGAAAVLEGGSFIVVWHSLVQDGDGLGVFGRRFDSSGGEQAEEFQISAATTNSQGYPSIAMRSDGSFVVAWQYNYSGTNYDILARRFDAAGTPQGSEFMVNSFTSGAEQRPLMAMEDNGDFVVVWDSNGQDGDYSGVFGQRFDSAGAALASEFQVNAFTAGYQGAPAVAMDDDGDFVVVWTSFSQAPDPKVFGQRFDSSGGRQASEFQIDTFTSPQGPPTLEMHADGDFLVVWGRLIPGEASQALVARRFDATGTPLSSELQVNAYTLGYQGSQVLTMDGDRDFVVAWSSAQFGPLAGFDVFTRRFAASGAAETDEVKVNSTTTGDSFPSAAVLEDDGSLLVVWTRIQPPADIAGDVFAQRFASNAAVLDIDSNGSLAPLSDGLLVLRFLFGFTGAALTEGAIGTGCARCTVPTLEHYLGALGDLDIDGNSDVAPLTDGLLILRYLFGFRGDALIIGAVGPECSRCDSPGIELYLAGLV